MHVVSLLKKKLELGLLERKQVRNLLREEMGSSHLHVYVEREKVQNIS